MEEITKPCFLKIIHYRENVQVENVSQCQRHACQFLPTYSLDLKKRKLTWKDCRYGGESHLLSWWNNCQSKPEPEQKKKGKQILIQAWEREKNPGMNPPGTYFVVKKVDALRRDQLPREYYEKAPSVCKVARMTPDGNRIETLNFPHGRCIAPGEVLSKDEMPGVINFCRKAGKRLRSINQRNKKEQQKGRLRTWRI